MTVFPGDGIGKDEVMETAEEMLRKHLDGSDFTSICVDDAVKDDY